MPSIRIAFASGATFDLPINPDLKVQSNNVYDEITQPPSIVAVDEEWTCSGAFLVNAVTATLLTDFNALDALLRASGDRPTRVILRNGGGDARTLGGTGFDEFKCLELSTEPTPGGFTNNISYTIRASARRKVANSLQIKREIQITFDPAGLTTQRVSGEVLTASGTSAQTAATTLGTQTLPGSTYGFQTNGPSGVNVTVLDGAADTRATFESVMQEFGEALPAGVSRLTHTIEERTDGGETTTRITVEAHGTGALVAVRGYRPSTRVDTAVVTEVRSGRIASAEYITKTLANTQDRFVVQRSFTIMGQGRPLTLIPITGPHNPILQGGRLSGTTVLERCVVEGRGVTTAAQLPIPNPPASIVQFMDSAAREETIELAERGADSAADLYRRTVTRTYRIPSKVDSSELVQLGIVLGKVTTGSSADGGDEATAGGGGGDAIRVGSFAGAPGGLAVNLRVPVGRF